MYIDRDSGLHRLHPLTKLALAFATLVAGLALPWLWAPYALFLLVVVPLALWGRVAAPLLGAAWRIVLPFAISLFLIQGFFWTGGTPLFEIGPFSLKQEGVLFAALMTGRILVIVSSFLLLTLSTRADALMIALSRRGAPPTLAYIILTTLQIIPRFREKAGTILDAQQARGLETGGSLGHRLRALLPLVQPLILGSIVDIEERAIALEARGFSRQGPKSYLLELNDSMAQLALRWLLVLAALLAIVSRFTM